MKKISCKFFYDTAGSKLFEKITTLPEYYLTSTEIPLIEKAAADLSDWLPHSDIIEFGSGDCTKISLFFDAISKKHIKTIRYIPFDVSKSAIEKSSKILMEKYPGLTIHGIIADFMSQLHVISSTNKKIFCFLGSTIGNLSMNEAKDFLTYIGSIMNQEDYILIGFDMVKNKNLLENAYNDTQRITEEFNKNILKVINNKIQTDFHPDDFDHLAFYNKDFSRIEMHLKAKKDIEITNLEKSFQISMKKGETIHTENSYKFTDETINIILNHADLTIVQKYSDTHNWFSLVLVKKK